MLPMNGRNAVLFEIAIAKAEVVVTKETVVRREGGRMGRGEHEVLAAVYDAALALSVAAPKYED